MGIDFIRQNRRKILTYKVGSRAERVKMPVIISISLLGAYEQRLGDNLMKIQKIFTVYFAIRT